MYTNALANFIIILIIGIAAGLIFERFAGASWLSRQVASSQRRVATSCLVGIAGAFIGFHLFALLGGAINGSLGLFIGAILFAAVVLWVWRMLR